MNPPVFFIVGPVGHGKTTAREILSELTHLTGASCSDVIYAVLAALRGVSVEDLRALPKEELRPVLIEVGDWICQTGRFNPVEHPDAALSEAVAVNNPQILEQLFRHPSALVRTLYLNGRNVIDGVRRGLELSDARLKLEWNGVRSLVIHVEDPRKERIADNSEDLSGAADERVINDGTVEELKAKLAVILEKHFGKQDAPTQGAAKPTA